MHFSIFYINKNRYFQEINKKINKIIISKQKIIYFLNINQLINHFS